MYEDYGRFSAGPTDLYRLRKGPFL